MPRHEEPVQLGRAGLQVTRLGLGTAPLGGMYTSVTDQDATEVLEHHHGVHGVGAPLLVEMVERERGVRGRMDPVKGGFYPQAGLIGMDDVGLCELAPN